MALETPVFSYFNHLTLLVAREDFIISKFIRHLFPYSIQNFQSNTYIYALHIRFIICCICVETWSLTGEDEHINALQVLENKGRRKLLGRKRNEVCGKFGT